MMFALSKKVRRARPLLGTFVEITAHGRDETKLNRAIDAAFAAITQVHRLMSIHDPESDVSRINREGFPRGVTVHEWTWQVLKSAQRFASESNGAFDISVGSLLTECDCLPDSDHRFHSTATWRDIFLRGNREVFCRRPVVVDLGGIAKGYAVDRAVEVLRQEGVLSGIVNAGGDLRVFGSNAQTVHVRHPLEPGRMAGVVALRDRALATSGVYFSRLEPGREQISPLIDGRSRRRLNDRVSVSAFASDCLTADALTKIVLALREDAAPLLKLHRADAVLINSKGGRDFV